jgi:hypothetical protein
MSLTNPVTLSIDNCFNIPRILVNHPSLRRHRVIYFMLVGNLYLLSTVFCPNHPVPIGTGSYQRDITGSPKVTPGLVKNRQDHGRSHRRGNLSTPGNLALKRTGRCERDCDRGRSGSRTSPASHTKKRTKQGQPAATAEFRSDWAGGRPGALLGGESR